MKQKNKTIRSRSRPSFSKGITVWLMANGTAWIWCSYLLAYMGKEEIAEALSKVVATEILGVFALYAIKALFENISKNNSWPDKTVKAESAETEETELHC